jgi:hypothetical protein
MTEAPKLLRDLRDDCILALSEEESPTGKARLRTQLEEIEALLSRAEKAHSLLTTGDGF